MGRPDIRYGGTWTRPQRLKNDCIRVLIRFGVKLADRVPARFLQVLGVALGWLVYLLSRRLRQRALTQIRIALPAADSRRIARRSFSTAGRNLARCLLLRRPAVRASDTVIVSARARSILDRFASGHSGCIVMSAHFGPFEYIAAAVAELGYTASLVVRESYDPRLNELVDAHRRARGLQVIHRGAPTAALSIVRALRRGHLVGVLPDLPGRAAATPITLLAGTTPFAIGPERIACRAGAPLLAAWLEPVGREAEVSNSRRPSFQLRVEPVPTGAEQGGATQRMADFIAEAMRRSPEHCLWMGMKFQVFSAITGRTLTKPRT